MKIAVIHTYDRSYKVSLDVPIAPLFAAIGGVEGVDDVRPYDRLRHSAVVAVGDLFDPESVFAAVAEKIAEATGSAVEPFAVVEKKSAWA